MHHMIMLIYRGMELTDEFLGFRSSLSCRTGQNITLTCSTPVTSSPQRPVILNPFSLPVPFKQFNRQTVHCSIQYSSCHLLYLLAPYIYNITPKLLKIYYLVYGYQTNQRGEFSLPLNSIRITRSSFVFDSRSIKFSTYIIKIDLNIFILFEFDSCSNMLKVFNFNKLEISSFNSSKPTCLRV